jgi:hypothetical protein
MAVDPGHIEATLAAAVGNDPALIAELRLAFTEASGQAIEALATARFEAEWASAAARLRGLGASFGAPKLMALAEEALARPFDEGVVRRLRQWARRV